ncbi:MAG: ABC-2 transporter permease, partial [Pirellulales bacterium]|nr:ABC-2 transporter permease [Pirellulales bacterium]
MPVHDLGYRRWTGDRMPRILRPLAVAQSGISLVWRRRWLRFFLTLAWLPIVVPGFFIFVFEFSQTSPDARGTVAALLTSPMIDRPDLAQEVLIDPNKVRHEVWSTLILFFFRYPQLITMVLLVGLIAPMLVCYDLRSKAYLMYFSRPLTPTEYILGKSAVVWFFLGMMATIPALILYLVGVLLSPELSVVNQTWDIPLRVLGASVVLIVPTTALALCYSSYTSESRYASFAWFATWAMGFVAYQKLTFPPMLHRSRRQPGPGREPPPSWEELGVDLDRWRLLSPYHTLGKVEAWVFGLDSSTATVIPAVLVLLAVTVGGSWIVRRR